MKKIFIPGLVLLFLLLFLNLKNINQNVQEHQFLLKNTIEAIADNSTMHVAYFNNEPHVFLNKKTNKLDGAIYEMVEKYLAPEMGVKFIWDKASTTIPRQYQILETEKNYCAATLVSTPERQERFLFTAEPYFFTQTALAIEKNNPLKQIKSVEDIIKLKIGYAQNGFLSPLVKDDRLSFDLISDPNYHSLNLRKIAENRIDAAYAPDKAAFLYIIKAVKYEDKIKVLNLPEKPFPIHIVFSKNSKEIVNKYDKAFKKLDGQKLYLKILKKYLDIDQL